MEKGLMEGGSNTDLLSIFSKIEIKNEERILPEDLQYCEKLQQELYQVLDQLNAWYSFFKDKSAEYKSIYDFSFKEDGSVKIQESNGSLLRRSKTSFAHMGFTPFRVIDQIVENYRCAVDAFPQRLTTYFNEKYHITANPPHDDTEFIWGFRPTYHNTVDAVINYLEGKNFRETAVDILLKRFYNSIHNLNGKNPVLKKDRIIFHCCISFEVYRVGTMKMCYHSGLIFEYFCAGIAFASDDTFHGSSRCISGFNSYDIDFSRWYDLTTDKANKLKFYKNGKIEVQFQDEKAAEECYFKLKLDYNSKED